ncbi:UNVERIFIED_CONTAM: pimeloyl-ACP methyl ester carboxylesterase [Brevibacillus sp. OAP136]
MGERIIQVDGIELCTESFGKSTDPAVLLIMGATASMVWWEESFCRQIVESGRYVVRYDNRDTGRSTVYPPGSPAYTFEDMSDDAVRVLDAYGIEKAHIVGMSMGGMLAQMMALKHADRVLTVTLIATSNFAPELPPMEEKVVAFFEKAGAVEWTNDQAVADFAVEKWRVLAGSRYDFPEERIRQLAVEEVRRAANPASMNNHGLVSGGETYLTRTHEIAAPALVIHGTADPIIPYPHGQALAKAIPGAKLLTLHETGHELAHGDWDMIVTAIAEHTASPAEK